MDPVSIVEDREQTQIGLQMDGQIDRRTDRWTTWNQYTSLNFTDEGYNDTLIPVVPIWTLCYFYHYMIHILFWKKKKQYIIFSQGK